MTITPNETDGDDGPVNNNGRRVLGDKVDSGVNVKNNNSTTYFNRMNVRYARVPNADKSAVQGVRRVLFGPPADPEETRIWLEQRIQAALAKKSKTYNFDFFNEMPMEDRASDRYVWEPVKQAPQAPKTADVGCSRTLPGGKKMQAKVTDYIKCVKRKMAGDQASAAALDGGPSSGAELGVDTKNKRLRRFGPNDEEEMQG